MLILGIESSCDETAAAVVRSGHEVLGSVISSQVSLHAGFGGVIPELAAREHLRNISPVVQGVLAQSGVGLSSLSAIAVTNRPGLIPALLVGNAYAKGLAISLDLPLIGIDHFLAHIYGGFLGQPEVLSDAASYPILALVVSGGHTALVLITADGTAEIIGSTLDDAAGEALDKAAKILGLGYPGGPVIDRLARTGNTAAYAFPRGLTGAAGKPVKPEHRFDFSFSGVKTALLYAVKDRQLDTEQLADVTASYQEAVMQVLVSKTISAAEEFAAPLICMCGGVACNSRLRTLMAAETEKHGRKLLAAPPKLCTDNAAMVAGLAYHYHRHGQHHGMNLGVEARLNRNLGKIPFVP